MCLDYIYFLLLLAGSINNIDDGAVKCQDGKSPEIHNKVISGVVGAASSVTSIQVANLLRLFKIPQVSESLLFLLSNCLFKFIDKTISVLFWRYQEIR